MITISNTDLPFLRFVKRNQLASSYLRRISGHPQLNKLERGDLYEIELDITASDAELALLDSLSAWWEIAEYQGISIRLLQKIREGEAVAA